MMTLGQSTVESTEARLGAGVRWLRAAAAGLHLLVGLLAVFSLWTNRFDLWIDLRLLGGAGAMALKIVWGISAVVVPWLAGPCLVGVRRPAWVNKGWAGRWSGKWARVLLWPSYVVVGILLVNTVAFYRLWWLDRIDFRIAVPITLPVALLLVGWAMVTRRWLRVARGLEARSPASGRTVVRAGVVTVAALAGFNGVFGLLLYCRPPVQPVDLAVVLGHRVLPDGTASVTLRARTMAAIDLYKRGMVKHLFLSGAVSPAERPGGPLLDEPLAMRRVCLENGVPAEAITLDSNGVNTRATAFDAAEYMRARGLKSVVACSDGYHLFRTAMSFREQGIEAYSVASVHAEWPCVEVGPLLREMAGVVVYGMDPWYRAPKGSAMKLVSPRVVVRKTAGLLEIYDGAGGGGKGTLVQTYACITGGRVGDKVVEGDRKTPIGVFHVVFKNPDSKYHLSLGLDYPNAEDALRGFKAGMITRGQYDGIIEALKSDLSKEENQKKLWYTPLGGEIFIHGEANGRSGTAGCVAVSNADIEEIYAALPVGTPVEIRP